MAEKMVGSECKTLKEIFANKYNVDFYQREYVWTKKQLEDLIEDLSSEFLKNWTEDDDPKKVMSYSPYFMGEIVTATKENDRSAIIDGQQRITTFTLLMIYMVRTFGHLKNFPKSDFENAVYSNDYGEMNFTISVKERNDCMTSLVENGEYTPNSNDKPYVQNIIDRYNDIFECWNEQITENNVVNFSYWLLNKVKFSKVWTNDDEFAYVIFETMNDRGLPLTKVEMLRSYLLANIASNKRDSSIATFDNMVRILNEIKLSSKSKAVDEFFKVYLRGHYVETFTKNDSKSDFVYIGNGFHRWVRENSKSKLHLYKSDDFVNFINELSFYSRQYKYIYDLIEKRDATNNLYLIVNEDYSFTLQPALILSAIKLNESKENVDKKIAIVSKYLTKVLTWRTWNHWMISQSSMEGPIYQLCKLIKDKDINEIKTILGNNPIELPSLKTPPILNRQNKPKIKVLLSLITEIVAKNSGESNYMLNQSEDIEVEHIWSDHFEQHKDEFPDQNSFSLARNNLGDLLVLPKTFNASYGDAKYETKVEQYFSQNILAQSLNEKKYKNNPGFIKFKDSTSLDFKSYDHFKYSAIIERAELYKNILLWNFEKNMED